MVVLSFALVPTSGFVSHPFTSPTVLAPKHALRSRQLHCIHHVQHERCSSRARASSSIASPRLLLPTALRRPPRGRFLLHMANKAREEGEGGTIGEADDYQSKGIYGLDREIIEREAAEAPLRKTRLVAYGVFAFAALTLGCVSLAGLAGVEEVKELGENLPNPLLDAGVLGLAFYLWVEEVRKRADRFLAVDLSSPLRALPGNVLGRVDAGSDAPPCHLQMLMRSLVRDRVIDFMLFPDALQCH